MERRVSIRVLLVHRYELARRGLRRMLEDHEDIEVVGEASNAVEALSQAELVSPDVILMDAELPYVSGLETIRILKERGLPGAVVVLSLDVERLGEALRLGAGAYLVEETEADELASVIRQVPEGGFVLGASLMKTAQGQETALRYLAEQQTRDTGLRAEALEEPESEQHDTEQWGELTLTPKQQDVMALLAKNASDKAIATRLSITERAVKGHVSRIRYMLGVASRRQVVEYAKRAGGVREAGREATLESTASGDPGGPRAESDASIEERPHESEASPDSQAPDAIIGDVVLVISPPLEPTLLIRLHSWLKKVVMADVDQTVGSWGEDTQLRSSLRMPMPLLRMLTELPYIAEVTEEPYRGGEWDVSDAVQRLGGTLSHSSGFTLPKRFRVTLKAE